MNIDTGREFSFTNPQDDPELYPPAPPGFSYDLSGRLMALPFNSVPIVGMTVPDAVLALNQQGRRLRIVEEDGKGYAITQDMRRDRVNVVVNNGKVTSIKGNY